MIATLNNLLKAQAGDSRRALETFNSHENPSVETTGLHYAGAGKDTYSLTSDRLSGLPGTRCTATAIDLSYKVLGDHDTVSTVEVRVGRLALPAQPTITYTRTAPGHTTGCRIANPATGEEAVQQTAHGAREYMKTILPGMQQIRNAMSPRAQSSVAQSLAARPCLDVVLVRLANLYLAAVLCHMQGKTATLTPTRQNITAIVNIEAWESTMEALSATRRTIAFVADSDGADWVWKAQALASMLADDVTVNHGGAVLPTSVTTYARTGAEHITLFGVATQPGPVGAGGGYTMTPELVWEMAAHWCGQHGLLEEWLPTVQSMAALLWSAEQADAAVFQSPGIAIGMGGMHANWEGLLPITTACVQWQLSGIVPPEPKRKKLLVQGAAVGVALGAAVRDAWLRYGGRLEEFDSPENPFAGRPASAQKRREGAVELMLATQGLLNVLGLQGKLGRFLNGLLPVWEVNPPEIGGATTWLKGGVYQWEEALLAVPRLAQRSTLRAVLEQPPAAENLVTNRWYRADQIFPTATSGYRGMAILQGLDLQSGYTLADVSAGTVTSVALPLTYSYRGAISDWSVEQPLVAGPIRGYMAWKVTNAEGLMQFKGAAQLRRARRWYWDASNSDEPQETAWDLVDQPPDEEATMWAGGAQAADEDDEWGSGKQTEDTDQHSDTLGRGFQAAHEAQAAIQMRANLERMYAEQLQADREAATARGTGTKPSAPRSTPTTYTRTTSTEAADPGTGTRQTPQPPETQPPPTTSQRGTWPPTAATIAAAEKTYSAATQHVAPHPPSTAKPTPPPTMPSSTQTRALPTTATAASTPPTPHGDDDVLSVSVVHSSSEPPDEEEE